MIRLDLKREPSWLDLVPGVRVHVRPCTTALIMAARAKLMDPGGDVGARTAALLRELAILAIDAWEGVGDVAGEAVPVSPQAITAVMDLWPVAQAFERLYLGPAMVLDAEKKRLTALAKWHFGDGPQYCGGCRQQNRPCASGGRGADGSPCPYVENAPATEAGWQAWDVLLRCSGQIRVIPGAAVGLDFAAALAVGVALGYDAAALAELLPAAEAGMISAINERIRRNGA